MINYEELMRMIQMTPQERAQIHDMGMPPAVAYGFIVAKRNKEGQPISAGRGGGNIGDLFGGMFGG